jgi:hypothetical protein
MKLLTTIVLSLAIQGLSAQCTVFPLGNSGDVRMRWCAGQLLPDGGMMVAAVPNDEPALGGLVAMRLDQTGTIVQSRFIQAIDPTVRLMPTAILPAVSGGMFVMGHRAASTMENYFALEVDASGSVV